MEVGLTSDLDLTGPIGSAFVTDPKECRRLQLWLSQLPARPVEAAVLAERGPDGWRSVLVALGGDRPMRLCPLSSRFVDDLFTIGREVGTRSPKPPQVIADVHLFGARTVVLPPDYPREGLLEPWATTGFFLAPVVHGYPRVTYASRAGARHG